MSNTKDAKTKADQITKNRSLWAAAAGLIPIPVVDAATILGVQVVMVRDIANAYNLKAKWNEKKVRHFIHVLIGNFGTAGVLSSFKVVPILGPAVGMLGVPLAGGAATYAIGKVFTQHFDQGGTLLDFNPETTRDFFKEQYNKAKSTAKAA